ncbi:hypothetical protein P8C59_008660 [Phyllachora maydis]|uniref:Integrase catalytic domain-containing protein n=1 Tax=Phyllachora maydis TaxID=1825666 RepID=A0AAD9IB27_9PEZI|nr:hypothetical protein P8C59_008660 [Phyllachora maydis]
MYPNRTDPSDPNPADLNPNPAAPSPLGAINKAPERLGYSFSTYLITATTATATTTTTTSAANPATTITATRSSDISFNSPFKGLSSTDLGQSSRPLPPIRTLLEDKEDGEDYSEVIEVLKQYIKSYKRVIASQSSDIKTLLLSLNTLKASIEDSISAIKNISSTLAFLTNSINATTTGKTSYSSRFDPFSGTIDLDSPLRPPRKEPHLGPAVNSATSNLEPPIDIGSKEGFKDTITSSIARMLGLIASSLNIEYLIADILEESRNLATEAYRAAYVANSSNSTSNSNSNPSKIGKNKKKGKKKASYNVKGQNYSAKSAEQASFMLGSYNLAIEEEEESDSSSNSNFKKSGFFLDVKGSSKPILYANFAFPLGLSSYTTKSIELQCNKIVVEIPSNSIRKEDYRPIIEDAIVSEAIEPNKRYKLRNSPAKGTTLEGIAPSLRGKRPCRPVEPLATAQAPYQSPCKTRKPKPLTGTRDLPYMLREPVIEGNKVEKAISSPTLKEPNIGQRDYYNLLNLAKLWVFNLPNKSGPIVANAIKGFFRGLRNGFGRYPTKFHFDGGTEITDLLTTWLAKRDIKFSTSAPYIHEQNGLVERSVRVILDLELVNSTAITNKETTSFQALFDELEPGIPYIPNLERYRAIGTRGEAIIPLEKRSKSLEFTSRTEEYKLLAVLGSKTYLVYIPSRRAVLKTSTVKFIKDNIVLKPIFTPKPIEVIAPNQPITNEPLNNSDLISEGDKMQLDYYKLLAKTSSYILSFIYKARKRVISKDSTPTTYNQVLKLPRNKRSKWLEAITKEFIQLLELGVFKFLPRSLLPSNYKLITCQNVLKVKKDAKNRPIKYKSRLVARGFMQVEGLDYTITYASTTASNKAIYKLLLKYGYNPSTPNIIKLSKALYNLGVFYDAKTCHFIVTYIDNCLFIGPNIGYITDLKKRLNKYIEEAVSCFNLADSKPISIPLQLGLVSQLQLEEDIASHLCNSIEIKLYQSLVGTAIYIILLTRVDISFTVQWLSRSLNRPTKSHLNAAKNLFKYLNSTKDYSICFSYNGNTVANLGPKLSNSSNTTTKLSRDFHSKEGPRPLTTTSTTIVDSRNSKGSSRTSIINSSLVPIGFSDSDFSGDKATSKSTYGYLYKLAGRPISWKTKRATAIALSTLEAETNGLTEAIREVQWIIGLFSELYRPIDYLITLYGDNQGSIIVANNPALHARTKHTLLKFRYVREQVKAKIVTIIYLNTKFNSTGYFTAL